MSQTDFLRLNEYKISKNVRASLPKALNKTTNLICVKDGVWYAWDLVNVCVLALNLKAARGRDGDNVSHQNLLPLSPCLFEPEMLLVNDQESLLVVAGPSGVLVMELPARYPPYGMFEHNNKEVVYCKCHSLDERLFLCSQIIEVRQVRFHPASPRSNHILVLTSDNTLRLYLVENGTASSLSTYSMGDVPQAGFPGTKTSYLSALGETGVDFDFGQPEIAPRNVNKQQPHNKSNINVTNNQSASDEMTLVWPVYVLWGNGSVFNVNIPIDQSFKPKFQRTWTNTDSDGLTEEACSVICLNTTPEIVCVANSNGTIYHYLLLNCEEEKDGKIVNAKELLCFEAIELELGLMSSNNDICGDQSYKCPIFLHKDESKINRYFATHSAGVQSITITCLKDLQRYATGESDETNLDDIFHQESKADYLLCTKTSDQPNAVLGFALYYEPPSWIAILSDGTVMSLALMTTDPLPPVADMIGDISDLSLVNHESPLKQMLRVPFDQFIYDILKRNAGQPLLKSETRDSRTQKECYELLQSAAPVLREMFECHNRARDEIERRVRALRLLKEEQLGDLERMRSEQRHMRATAEHLAEKHEDIRDAQAAVTKRCEQVLVLVSQRKDQATMSDAERQFIEDISKYSDKVKVYQRSIEKLKLKVEYQRTKIENWKAQQEKQVARMGETHTGVIKESLEEMSTKISDMVKEVQDIKDRLNLK